MIGRVLFFLLATSWAALAQQQQPSDPVTLQRILASTQAQRNQFLDALTAASARIDALTDDLGRAQVRIKELESAKTEISK
jgi:hypothetical protein